MESKLLRRYPLGSFLFLPTIAHPTMQSRVGLSLSRAPGIRRPEAVRKDPSLAFRPGRDLVVLKCDYQEIMLVAREFSSFARRDCNGKNADIVVFEQQTMMRLSRDLDQNLLLRRQHAGQHDKQGGALHE